MSVKERSAAFSRRGFLKGVALAGSAAAATAVVSKTATADATADAGVSPTKKEAEGYHETPHILEYYEKARF